MRPEEQGYEHQPRVAARGTRICPSGVHQHPSTWQRNPPGSCAMEEPQPRGEVCAGGSLLSESPFSSFYFLATQNFGGEKVIFEPSLPLWYQRKELQRQPQHGSEGGMKWELPFLDHSQWFHFSSFFFHWFFPHTWGAPQHLGKHPIDPNLHQSSIHKKKKSSRSCKAEPPAPGPTAAGGSHPIFTQGEAGASQQPLMITSPMEEMAKCPGVSC